MEEPMANTIKDPVDELTEAPLSPSAVGDRERALRAAAEIGVRYLAELPERHVGSRINASALRERLGGPMPEAGRDPVAVLHELAEAVDPGLVASAGPRYFGFVIGGALPASLATDWLTAVWAQNGALHALSPAASAAEQVAGEWMLDLLGLPSGSSVGFPTGAGLGNAVGLAAGRHALLARSGWDVEAKGLYGAPEINVLIGEEAHATVLTALQYLGLGRERVTSIPNDDQGRMRGDLLREAVGKLSGPLLVCAQAGNVNTGAFDPLGEIADTLAGRSDAWVHVDGAFGLWASAVPRLRHLLTGIERADSWSTDCHKWLNVGYDCGFVAVRDPEAHRASMAATAAYLLRSDEREPWEYVLDSSRRARGFVVWAALRSLGRTGLVALVERCCALARRIAEGLATSERVEILNEVVLNQVLVRFHPIDGGDADAFTRDVIGRAQASGEAWMGGTVWHGMGAMRISVSNWSTTEADADRTVAAILRAMV
jgi:glutamate/tyrosine decarboxylase-like PLP-dependent enzyme